MNKLFACLLICMVSFGDYGYKGSTTSVVTLVGGIIKAQNVVVDHKYKRKDCPICLGKGYYISGDKITKVECGYCEPEKNTQKDAPVCIGPNCKTQVIKK